MNGKRIVVGFMALALGLGAAGSAMAQRGGGGHGGQGGTSMMHRDAQGSASAAGTREHRRDMVQEHRQLSRDEGMERQMRHGSARQAGRPGAEGETPGGPSEHASTTAHEAVDHRGEGTGTAAAVHAVNSSQNHAEERKEIGAGQ